MIKSNLLLEHHNFVDKVLDHIDKQQMKWSRYEENL